METRDKVVIGQVSVDVMEAVKLMSSAKMGEVVEYKDLTRTVGRDVTVHRHIVTSARRILMRDHNMVFRAEQNVGYRRLDDVQVVDIVNADRAKRIRTQATTAVKEISVVDYGALSKDKQVSHNAGLAMFGVLIQATGRSEFRKLRENMSNASGAVEHKGIFKLIGWS